MLLKPSEIFFTQDSIGNTFGRHNSHRNTNIGETLDSICEGRCSVRSIPSITVVKRGGKWFSVDNRRLWVFRHLERLGKCTEIEVIEGWSIPTRKFTTKNGGTSVTIYKGRRPGGSWYFKPTVYVPRPVTPKVDETRPSDSNASQVTKELGIVTQDPLVGEHESKSNTLKRKDESSPPTSPGKRMKILDREFEKGAASTETNTTIKPVTVSGGRDTAVKRKNESSSSILAVGTLAGKLLRRTDPFDQQVSRTDTFDQLVRRTNSVGHHVRRTNLFEHVVKRNRAAGTYLYEHIIRGRKLHEQILNALKTAIKQQDVSNKNDNNNDDSYDEDSDVEYYDDYIYSYDDNAVKDAREEFYYDDGEDTDDNDFDNGIDSGNGDDSDEDDEDVDKDDDDDDDVNSDVSYSDDNDDDDNDSEVDVDNDDDNELNYGDDNDVEFDDDENNDDDSNDDADDDDSFYDEDTDDDLDDDNDTTCCDDTVDASDDEKKDAATTDKSEKDATDNSNFESQNIVSRYVLYSEIRCSDSQQTNLDTKDAIVDGDEKKDDNAYNDKKIILIITKKKDADAYDDNKDETHNYKKKDTTDDDDTCNKTDDTNNKKDDTLNYKKKDTSNNKKDATSDNDKTKKDEGNSNDNKKNRAIYNDKVDDYVDNNDDDEDDDGSNNTQNDVNRRRRRATRFNFLMKAACHPYVNLQYEF